MSLAKIFWIAACLDVVLILVPALEEWNHPSGEFSGLVVLGEFAIISFLAVIMLAVAVTRKRVAYWIGLALLPCRRHTSPLDMPIILFFLRYVPASRI